VHMISAIIVPFAIRTTVEGKNKFRDPRAGFDRGTKAAVRTLNLAAFAKGVACLAIAQRA